MALILVLQNVSNLAEISDYRYEVLIGDGTPERSHRIARGEVKGHRRAMGWRVLIQELLDQTTPQPAPSRPPPA